MSSQNQLLSPCGLYCGACGIMIAHREGDQKLKEKLAAAYGLKPSDIACEGCLSEKLFVYCRACPVRKCAGEKGLEGCYLCSEFPVCPHINNFPYPAGKENIMRAIPEWKKLGTEKWVAAEMKRYSCPKCGAQLFRGAKRCRACKEPVAS
jgi:hypothetical protein